MQFWKLFISFNLEYLRETTWRDIFDISHTSRDERRNHRVNEERTIGKFIKL